MEELFKGDSPSFPLKSLTDQGVVGADLSEVSAKIFDLVVEAPGVADNPQWQGGWQGGTASGIQPEGRRLALQTCYWYQDKRFWLSIYLFLRFIFCYHISVTICTDRISSVTLYQVAGFSNFMLTGWFIFINVFTGRVIFSIMFTGRFIFIIMFTGRFNFNIMFIGWFIFIIMFTGQFIFIIIFTGWFIYIIMFTG